MLYGGAGGRSQSPPRQVVPQVLVHAVLGRPGPRGSGPSGPQQHPQAARRGSVSGPRRCMRVGGCTWRADASCVCADLKSKWELLIKTASQEAHILKSQEYILMLHAKYAKALTFCFCRRPPRRRPRQLRALWPGVSPKEMRPRPGPPGCNSRIIYRIRWRAAAFPQPSLAHQPCPARKLAGHPC